MRTERMRNPRGLRVQNAGAGDQSNPIYKGLQYRLQRSMHEGNRRSDAMLRSVWKKICTLKRQPELVLVSQALSPNWSLPAVGISGINTRSAAACRKSALSE
jgi:hypothetical protein